MMQICSMDSKPETNVQKTIRIAHYEGVSFLLLLLVAMPLKYKFDLPIAVTIAGSIHGILFIAYMWRLYDLFSHKIWNFRKCAVAVLLGFLPAGTFFLKP